MKSLPKHGLFAIVEQNSQDSQPELRGTTQTPCRSWAEQPRAQDSQPELSGTAKLSNVRSLSRSWAEQPDSQLELSGTPYSQPGLSRTAETPSRSWKEQPRLPLRVERNSPDSQPELSGTSHTPSRGWACDFDLKNRYSRRGKVQSCKKHTVTYYCTT